jgi:molybdopterin synthase catalytic subunit
MVFKIHREKIDTNELTGSLYRKDCGAVVTFQGRVRNHNQGETVIGLHYEAYEELARKEAEKILTEAKGKFDVAEIQSVHRVGKLVPGDLAFWVGASSAHREASFQSTRFVVDEIKDRVPIWKEELYRDDVRKFL